ncbi:hypothetical protein JHK85_057225 [Glycine max]|nr:hypothetical protein JHK85_057225 [Glycine max]
MEILANHSPHEFQNDDEWSTENIVGFLSAPASKPSWGTAKAFPGQEFSVYTSHFVILLGL